MYLVIVGGQASTGKTYLSRRIENDLPIRAVRKDDYKELQVFPKLLKRPSLWQLYQAEKQSWQQLYDGVAQAQAEGQNLLIEGNFGPDQRKKLQRIIWPSTQVAEVFLYAQGFTTYNRYVERYKSGQRHPGHRDNLWSRLVWLENAWAYAGWKWVKPLGFKGALMEVDTTQYDNIDYPAILQFTKNSIR